MRVPGVLIYFGYGMWNSTLEITAREEEVHASTYQRYGADVDEGFAADNDLYPGGDGGPFQPWGAPEDTGYSSEQQRQPVPAPAGGNDIRTPTQSSRAKSKGKAGHGFQALIVDDELDYSPE